jgi:S1-C subfamily serine protease
MKQALKRTLLNLLKFKLKVLSLTAIALTFIVMAAKAPEVHGFFLRSRVGNKTYMIKKTPNGGGGSGFAVRAKSGTTYIVTNAHVCEALLDNGETGEVLVETPDGEFMKRRVLEVSGKSDLCLIEGLPGVTGLSLGSRPTVGQIVAAVGHPALLPTTISRGEIVGAEDVRIPIGLISSQEEADRCLTKPKREIGVMFVWFFPVNVCVDVTKEAYITNAVIQGGSSGSPVVNFWGNVVGVAFAADRAGWARVVSLDDLKDLLKLY